MNEIYGDMFSELCLKFADAVCITTNGMIKTNGKAVMGAGIAKVARDRFKGIDEDLANGIGMNGHIIQIIRYTERTNHHVPIISFPTKHDWVDKSDIELIEKSLIQLVELVNERKWSKIILPRPGCSNGQLNWLKDVRPLLRKYLDDRFHVITYM